MNADGGGKRRVTSYPGGRGLVALSWSPDGERIAFVRNESIWVVNAEGTAPRRLIRNAGLPAWSPDGSKILFVGQRGGQGSSTEIWVANANGTGQRRLTHGDGAWNPAWSPDGRRIAFSRGESGIFLMRQNGTAVRRVARGDWPFCLTWSPTGAASPSAASLGSPLSMPAVADPARSCGVTPSSPWPGLRPVDRRQAGPDEAVEPALESFRRRSLVLAMAARGSEMLSSHCATTASQSAALLGK
jgi:Tol biopolymer transport system component